MKWINWAKNVQCQPKNFYQPSTLEELQEIVKSASQSQRKVRVVGSGHSFTKVCHTDDIMIDIAQLNGIIDVDKTQKQITFWAGTTVKQAGELCLANGLAQENLGDFDHQTLAGAVSTGTHGSGLRLTGIAHQIVAFWIVTANGELLECSPQHNKEAFMGGRVSMGTLGVIVKVKLQLVDAYKLKCETSKVKFFDILPKIPQLLQENRNLEFFYFPMTEYAMMKQMNITTQKTKDPKWKNYINQNIIENKLLKILCDLTARFRFNAQKINKLMASFVSNDVRINDYNKILATERDVRFLEMEFNIPVEHFESFALELKSLFEQNDFHVYFPMEIRWVKADDIWLSPTYQRDAVYFAAHTYLKSPVKAYFEAIQEIAKKYEGRPHWGKIHYLDKDYLSKVYPKWDDFLALRAQLDPQNTFLSPYMESVLL